MCPIRRLVLGAACVVVLGGWVPASPSTNDAACALGLARAAQFSSGVTLVEVYATASDAAGNPVPGLRQGDFEVREDGAVQRISAFAAGDFPLSVALAIDRSWSMAGDRLPLAKQAARTFLGELRPTDRAMLIAVASDTELMAPLSTDRGPALRALAALQPWSTSALYDAVVNCLEMIQPATGRRALVLLSDGEDRYSSRTAADALEKARQTDVLVYPVGFGKRAPVFTELAVQTGGRSFAVGDSKDLPKTFAAIARELRHQYLLGYVPARPAVAGKPEWRSIEVRALKPGVKVRARPGYLAR
ncbi:MAG: VWA domain-containing protein [Bacteroidales bacterium]